jgi:hypothetical protein
MRKILLLYYRSSAAESAAMLIISAPEKIADGFNFFYVTRDKSSFEVEFTT